MHTVSHLDDALERISFSVDRTLVATESLRLLLKPEQRLGGILASPAFVYSDFHTAS
jgi:hypothetical protein